MNNAVFILTYQRPKEQITLKMLREQGYTGDVYLIVDDTDDSVDELKELHKHDVKDIIVFDKEKYYETTDTIDNFHNLKSVVYARNACFDIAKKLKIDNFIMIDDDIKGIQYRYEEDKKLKGKKAVNLDEIFNSMFEFLNSSDNIMSLSLGNAGSYIGGLNGRYKEKILLGNYGIYFLKTSGKMAFKGLSNEDAIVGAEYNKIGKYCYIVLDLQFDTFERGTNDGGLNELYKVQGSYVRSFYAVISNPGLYELYIKDGEYECGRKGLNFIGPKLLNERWKKG